MVTPLAFLLLLLGALAIRPQAALAAPSADAKSATVGIRNGNFYPIPAFTGTADLLNNLSGYQFASVPAAATGVIAYPQAADGSGNTYFAAATNTVITTQQATRLFFVPAATAAAGTISFTYSSRQPGAFGSTTVSPAATYTLLLSAADAQTSPVLSSSAGQKAIAALTAGTTSPTNYIIKTLPSSGTLFVNGTAATTNQIITAAQAAQLSYAPAAGYFGTTFFTYAPADANTTATAGAGDVATYTLPVTTASCGSANSVLDLSRRPSGEDWTNHASVTVNSSSISSGSYTATGAGASSSFTVANNAAFPGPSLFWLQDNTGFDPATTPNTATVTFTFDKPVRNLSLAIQDIDQNITAAANFTDALTLDGYSTAGSTSPITLTAANFALASTTQFSGNNTVVGTGNSDSDPAGNIVVTFPSPVQRLTLTFKNVAPYTSATISRTHAVGIASMTWCRQAPVANDVTTTAVPSTATQANINGLSATPDGTTITAYLITALPAQGTLFYNNGGTYTAVALNQSLTPAQAASLRYTPNPAFTGTSTTFSYQASDDAGVTSANTATYTIPLNYIAPCTTATNTLSFATQTAGDDWTTHAAVFVPAGSTVTSVSSGSYTSGPTVANTSSLQIANVNGVRSLAWTNQYSSTTAGTGTAPGPGRSSSVTFTFNRAITNLSLQVQDIDFQGGSFTDQVVFSGANSGTPVTPTLTALNPNAGTVTISGNTATGRDYNTNNTTDGTVVVYFPSAITTLTITYNNATASSSISSQQGIGIDFLSWCRQAPVANNVTTATVPSAATQAGIANLSGTADGTGITSYTITSLPANGTLYYYNGTTNVAVTNNQVLTAAQSTTLTYTPNPNFTGSSASFTYKATDDANVLSTNTATFTIPLQYTAPCATASATLDYSAAYASGDWTNHAALGVPAGNTTTTISSGAYSVSANSAASLATGTVNGRTSLAWANTYTNATGNARTSSVTFTFNRAVSNFTVQVQDIDSNTGFTDRVTFTGANSGTAVTPVLTAANANSGVVSINGNVATGLANTESQVDGTVTAFFSSPITTLTITYANATGAATPGNQAIGIDQMTWCRQAPTATNITNTSRPGGQGATPINPLIGTADGTPTYVITALPPAAQGTFYVNGVALTSSNLTLTAAQAAQLTFAPAATFSGNAGFSYYVQDDAGVASNTATYVVPVTATGTAGTPAPCATPGKDGSPTLTTNPDTYYPSNGDQMLKVGDKTIKLGVATGAGTAIAAGDLLLVIQMQGATIDASNNPTYGTISSTNYLAGQYEYVVASSAVPATGGTVTLQNGLANAYTSAVASATTGQYSFQVVRVPQYNTLTLGGNLSATPWNGSTGGIIALDVAGQTNLGTYTVSATGAGFRGGAGRILTGIGTATGYSAADYRNLAGTGTTGTGGTKGEGTAGTPRYVSNGTALVDTRTSVNGLPTTLNDGYPNGDNDRGAPGNAGGGGTDSSPGDNQQNSGGGGGANGGNGGRGGNAWNSNAAIGGEPGATFAATSTSRLVLGGGGGSGSTNNGTGTTGNDGFASSGAAGGGIVILRTGTLSAANGSAIVANGANASNAVTNDGSGGGGAGGSILVTATSGLGSLNLSATGGTGGTNTGGGAAHGPGGGGGGGVILTNGSVAAATATAGTNGTTAGTPAAFGAAAGQPGVTSAQVSSSIANSAAGTTCVANVATTITGPSTASAGQPTGNFTATFSNANTSGAANVTQTVTLPTGAGLTAAQQATIVAAYPGTTFTTTGSGTGINTTINFGTTTLLSGASNSFVFAYTAPTTAGTVSTTSNTSTTTNEAGQTANNTASVSTTVSVAADVTVSLTGPTTLNAGQPTGTYTATFTNEGPGTATTVARLITLPAGASLTTSQQATIVAAYSGATFSTTGSGTSAVTIINFGSVPMLASDAFSVVRFAFTAPSTTSTNLTLTGNTSTTAAEGSNLAPNQSTLTLATVETADVVATITGSTSLVGTVPTGTFNVAFANNGPQTANGVTRTVQLPTGLTGVVVSGSDAGTYNATTGLVTYTTTPTTLASGASLTSTITFPIPATGAQVVATANVNTTTNEAGLMGNNSATAVLPAAYDLATTISGPTTAAIAGSPVTLYVTTTNNGPSTAPTALQTVSIPSSAPLTNVYITNGGTYSYNNTTKIGTVTFPDPANPTSGVTVTNLPSGQTIANSITFTAPAENFAPTATVALNSTSTGTGDLNTANNTANLNNGASGTPVVVNTNTATLATANVSTTITTTSTIVSAGTAVTYKVSATNHGPGIATNVVEQVQLLPNLTTGTLALSGTTGVLSGTTITYSSGGTVVATYSTTTGILTYATLATQASGTPATQNFADIVLTVPATTGNNGQLLVTAAVRTGTNDPVPADNVSAVAVKVTSTADLATTLTGPTSTTAGQTASYTVAFTNNGSSTAGTVVETMQLPAGLSNVVVQDPAGNVLAGAYSATTGLVTFPTVASDASGATQVYNVLFTAPGQTYSVSSSIGSGTPDNVGTNNAAALRTTVTPAADVAVSVSGPATATTGNAVTYAVTTLNNGPDAASGVVPSIQLASNLSGVTVIGGAYDAASGKVTFNSYSLAVGESRVSLVSFTMPANPTNGFVTGTAAVTTTSTDLVATNNTAGITTGAAPATPDMADLVTSITPSATTVTAGSPLSYTIKFRNNTAGTPAINAVPTAYLPAGLTGVVVKDAGGMVLPNAYNSVTGQITFPTIPSLTTANGPDYTIDLPAPTNANNVLISASAVSANTSDPNPANNSVGNTVNITPSFDEVTRLAGPATALPGSTNTYTVTTTNNGPSTAPASAGTVQTVTLPAGVTATNITGGGVQSGNTITFPAISTTQASGANGAITNTFSIVMPATGSLALSAAVTSTGESLTTNNGATLTTAPTNQVPVADNVWNTMQGARGNTANLMATKGLPISPLAATDPDGSIASYTITSIPDAAQGVLYYNGTAVTAGQTVAASGLSFAPTSTFVGNATFTYTALDNASGVSNTALYTIPVAKDLSAVYTTYNSTRGGANVYVTGDILAQVADASTSTYNSAGLIYNATTGVLQGGGAANGLPTTGTNATITSGTLPAGVSLDPATGRIYVSKASDLVNNPGPQTYTVTITTVDSNGGVTTQPVSFTIGAYPLPVVLTEFTATAVANRDGLLHWVTASEKNNDHFEIERSFDGTSFVQIAKVAGHGTTTAASTYALTDANVAAKATGPVYYRLRQVDLDGTATYSPVRSVSFTKATTPVALSLYPNPAQASTTLELSQLPATGTYQVTLLDATGRTVRTATLGGGLPQPLDISDLATGAYHVVVTGQLADGSALRQVLRLTKE